MARSAARGLHDRAVIAGYGAEDSIAVLRLLEDEFGQQARRDVVPVQVSPEEGVGTGGA